MRRRQFVFEQLGKQHNRAAFCCGTEQLDHYFHQQAGQDHRRKVAIVYVLHDTASQLVAGFYTLSASYVRLSDLPAAERKRLPHYPELPATLIGRLAVDQNYPQQGLGKMLLMDALKRSYLSSSEIGSMAVAVDSKDPQSSESL